MDGESLTELDTLDVLRQMESESVSGLSEMSFTSAAHKESGHRRPGDYTVEKRGNQRLMNFIFSEWTFDLRRDSPRLSRSAQIILIVTLPEEQYRDNELHRGPSTLKLPDRSPLIGCVPPLRQRHPFQLPPSVCMLLSTEEGCTQIRKKQRDQTHEAKTLQ
ncbi:hypothetical protein NQZ68_014453 [Dissostichus eleginoides]|nr:hypothetical protein NQZ68_014453 [Dissostichus eleginoides]